MPIEIFQFLLQLAVIILATKLAGDASVRLGQPSVLGKLLVGIILGPAVFDWVHHSNVIDIFSTIGVLFLMFFAGLETDLKELNANRKSSMAVAVGGIIFPFSGGVLLGMYSGMSNGEALFLGLLLSATSVSITVQTFKDLGKLKSRESTTVLGAALADDVLVVILLAVLMSFLAAGDVSLSLVIGKKILFFVLIAILSWKVIPFVMNRLSNLKTNEAVIGLGVVICLFFSLIAEYLGVAGIIGAFAAGLAISQTKFREEVEQKLEPIAYAIFVPVFFVSIGLSFTLVGFSNYWLFTIFLTIIAVITKLFGAGLGARLTGFDTRSSMIIGAGMVSRGEVALIIASIGLSAGLLSQDYFSSTIIAIILSTIVTPPLLKYMMSRKNQE